MTSNFKPNILVQKVNFFDKNFGFSIGDRYFEVNYLVKIRIFDQTLGFCPKFPLSKNGFFAKNFDILPGFQLLTKNIQNFTFDQNLIFD